MSTETDGGAEMVDGATRAAVTVMLQGAQMIAQRRQWAAQMQLHQEQSAAREAGRHAQVLQSTATIGSTAPRQQIAHVDDHRAVGRTGPSAETPADKIQRSAVPIPDGSLSQPTAPPAPAGITDDELAWLKPALDNASERQEAVNPELLFPGMPSDEAHRLYQDLSAEGNHVGFQICYADTLVEYAEQRTAGTTPLRDQIDLNNEAWQRFAANGDLETGHEAHRHASAQTIRVARIQQHLSQLEGADELRSELAKVSAAMMYTVDTSQTYGPDTVASVASVDRIIQRLEDQAVTDYGFQPPAAVVPAQRTTPASIGENSNRSAPAGQEPQQPTRADAIRQGGFSPTATEAALIHDLTFGSPAIDAVTGRQSKQSKGKNSPHITAARGRQNRRTVGR